MACVQKAFVVGLFAMGLIMAANAQNCGNIVGKLAPCLMYLQTNGSGQPTSQCCNGVKQLAGMANTSLAKRQICNCLKPQINSYPKITDSAVGKLTSKCNAGVAFKISKSINCNTL